MGGWIVKPLGLYPVDPDDFREYVEGEQRIVHYGRCAVPGCGGTLELRPAGEYLELVCLGCGKAG